MGREGKKLKEGNVPISLPTPPRQGRFLSFSGGSIVVKRESEDR